MKDMTKSISTQIVEIAARRRGWQMEPIELEKAVYRITTDLGETYYLRGLKSHKTGIVGGYLANRKDLIQGIIEKYQLAHQPATFVTKDMSEAQEFLNRHKQIVVKPLDQAHGDGITVNVTDDQELMAAVKIAQSFGNEPVLIQQQVVGEDCRLLLIDGELAAAAVRKPAYVVGDGVQTIRQLVASENEDPRRGEGYEKGLTKIDIVSAENYLKEGMDSVPLKGQEVQVVGTANIGKGGESIDITDTVAPELVAEAQKIAQHFRLGLCGIDYIVQPNGKAYFIEINTAPSLGLHEFPAQGEPRGTGEIFLDWLTKKG